MWVFFFISLGLISGATSYMITTLPAKGVPTQVKFAVSWAWFITLLICSLVPIDVFSTLQSKDPEVLTTLWDVSYWSTQLLTWLVIPLYIGYAAAGEFTWKGRMWASVRSNAILAIALGVAVFIGLFWAVTSGNLNLTSLPNLAIQLNNTFGLFCVITLLGYGLVAIPKHLWKLSLPNLELRRNLCLLGRVMDEKVEAQQLLEATVRKIRSTQRTLGNSERVAHEQIEYMLHYIQECLGETAIDVQPQESQAHEGVRYTDELSQLHAEVKRDVQWIWATQAQAQRVCRRAVRLSTMIKAHNGEEALDSSTLWKQFQCRWAVRGHPLFLKGVALATGTLSALIVWCEVTGGISNTLSPLYHLIRAINDEFLSQLVIMLVLVYVIVCTFAAFFSINMGSMYSLLPAVSSSFSLLFNCNLVTRFAAPLCYNYLHVIGMDRPTADGHYTVFAQRMGLQPGDDVAIPFLGVDFNRWAPVMVLAVAYLTTIDAFGTFYGWVCTFLPFLPQQLDEDGSMDSQMYVMEGQRVVNRAMASSGVSEMTDLLMNLGHYVRSDAMPLNV